MYDMTGVSKVEHLGSMLRGVEVVRAIDLEIHIPGHPAAWLRTKDSLRSLEATAVI